MPVRERALTVGTTPLLAIPSSTNRVGWRVTFPSPSIIPANTGIIFVGKNFPPDNVLPSNQPEDLLVAGGELKEAKRYPDDKIFLGDLWLISSVNGQVVLLEEDVS